MKKLLFFSEYVSLAHIGRPLVLVPRTFKEGNWEPTISPSQSNIGFIYQAIVKLLNSKKTIQAVDEISKNLKVHDTKKIWLASKPVNNQILEETK